MDLSVAQIAEEIAATFKLAGAHTSLVKEDGSARVHITDIAGRRFIVQVRAESA